MSDSEPQRFKLSEPSHVGVRKLTPTYTAAHLDNIVVRSIFSKLDRWLEAVYAGPWKRSLMRERREREDLFMLMVFSESLGVENPAGWYTLELRGPMLEHFHDWHRRMGIEKSPLDDFRCC